MTITVYRSDDIDAPVLNGIKGSLIDVLDACLVNGYGSKAPAGWTKEYSGTNTAAYRISTSYPSTGMYLRINDNINTTDTAYSRAVGYETMSDIDTGTGLFPTVAQRNEGVSIVKSTTSNATVRDWVVIASNRFVYVFTGNVYAGLLIFGDIKSYKPIDKYNCIIYGAVSNSTGQSGLNNYFPRINNGPFSLGSSSFIHLYIARNYDGRAISVPLSKVVYKPHTISGSSITRFGQLTGDVNYADPVTGKLNLFKITVQESSAPLYRGEIPGMYEIHPGVSSTFPAAAYSTISSDLLLNNNSFMIVPLFDDGGTEHRCAIQITGDWYE